MRFREMPCHPRILKNTSRIGLENEINDLCKDYDLVDLQYSSTTLDNDVVEYSVLALVHHSRKGK